MSDSEDSDNIWSDEEPEFGSGDELPEEGEEEGSDSEGETTSEEETEEPEPEEEAEERRAQKLANNAKVILSGGQTFKTLLGFLRELEGNIPKENIEKAKKGKKKKVKGGNEGSDDENEEEEQRIAEEIADVFTFEGPEGIINTKTHKKIEIVPEDQCETSDVLSQAEMTDLIGIRATQIATNGIVYTNVEGLTSEIEMARKEFTDRKCPLFLMRKVGEKIVNGGEVEVYERFDVNKMARRVIYK